MAGRRGRPTAYEPDRHPFLAACLAREGLTEAEIADKLGVNERTLRRWKSAHPEFGPALKEGKYEADSRVENSLYRRALGYDYEETEVTVARDGDRGDKPARVKRVKKHVAPDVTACIFWLKNRRPDIWRDKSQQEISGPGGQPLQVRLDSVDLSRLTDEELRALVAIQRKLEQPIKE